MCVSFFYKMTPIVALECSSVVSLPLTQGGEEAGIYRFSRDWHFLIVSVCLMVHLIDVDQPSVYL